MCAPCKDRRAQTEWQWRAQSDALRCLQGNNPARHARSSMPTQHGNGEWWAGLCVPFRQCNVLHSSLPLLSLTPPFPLSASHLSLFLPPSSYVIQGHTAPYLLNGEGFPLSLTPCAHLPSSLFTWRHFTSLITLVFSVSRPLSHLNLCRTVIPPLLALFLPIYLSIWRLSGFSLVRICVRFPGIFIFSVRGVCVCVRAWMYLRCFTTIAKMSIFSRQKSSWFQLCLNNQFSFDGSCF